MQRRSEDLFEILVREHEPALRAFVRSGVDDPGAADDLVQETFLAAGRLLDEYDESHPFAHWLRGIAHHKVLAYYRDSATAGRHVRSLTPQALAAVADQLERLIPGRGDAMTDTLEALRGGLESLTTPDRGVLERAYRNRQTCRDITHQVGKTAEAVKKQIQLARASLKDCIEAKLAAEGAHG